MNPKCEEARSRDDHPFQGMAIGGSEPLEKLSTRSPCPRCGKSRMYFCYTCFVPVSLLQGQIPVCTVRWLLFYNHVWTYYPVSVGNLLWFHFQLPIKVDIIKHRKEIDGKSTAAHAAVLAPHDINVYTYPDVPDYVLDDRTVLLYPGAEAKTVPELFTNQQEPTYSEFMISQQPAGYNVGTLRTKIMNKNRENQIYHVKNLPIDKVVLIDSTWNQSRGIYSDERLQKIPKIVLQNRPSQFWRHQKGSPRWYLSTVEALHELMLELHLCAWGCSEHYKSDLTKDYPVHRDENHPHCKPYNGQYDNLLYFFKYMYEKLHSLYRHDDLLAYKRPMT